jgi:murein L,D-transpeptidase YcbB/YkuD
VTPIETIKRIQEALGVVSDGAWGRRSRAALNAVLTAAGQPGI